MEKENEKRKALARFFPPKGRKLYSLLLGTMAPPDKDGNAPAAAPPVLDLLAAMQRRSWTEAVDTAAAMLASSASSSATMGTSSSSGSSYHSSIAPLFAPRFARAALYGELPPSG